MVVSCETFVYIYESPGFWQAFFLRMRSAVNAAGLDGKAKAWGFLSPCV